MSKANKKDAGEEIMKEPEFTADGSAKNKPDEKPSAENKGDVPGADAQNSAQKPKKTKDKVEENGKTQDDAMASGEANEAGADHAGDLAEELASERDRYLRLAAEYDNYRKRSAKEREMIYSDARADTITKILPVYDNMERALKMECADEAFYKGVEMTMTQLTEILENIGLTQIPTKGETFDPNKHNAVMAIEDPELGEKIIAEEYQKGFMLGDRVIRHSTVVVAN